jgi:phosphotransferase system HPr (HPr) family protein
MPSKTVVLRNEHGLHARPAAIFVKAAAAYACDVRVSKAGKDANAKSMLSVLTLECHSGDEIAISAEGEDAEAALDDLVSLVEGGLGE